jgi:hypothetical protein
MKRIALLTFVLAVVALGAFVASGGAADSPEAARPNQVLPASELFDSLGQEPDVVYLFANSSVVFGPDPHGRSEEITFVGPVTVPKWPMKGYGRRVLPDGRQQIDIELTQSDLTGESYVMGGPVILGEHPDLRSLGTITERPNQGRFRHASNEKPAEPKTAAPAPDSAPAAGADQAGTTAAAAEEAEEVPADFVVKRKVLLTTAKGILYNETAVPVRGRIDSIPPVRFQGTPVGVNTFRGMELPVALLDKSGNVNGWFYSKAHMAYAVKPAGIERSFLKGTVELRQGERTEKVSVSGPVEIHHLATGATKNDIEFMVLALRGRSELLGGDIMFAETFSDRDHFSKGQTAWQGNGNGESSADLYLDLYTPATKLTVREPIPLKGAVTSFHPAGNLDKGKLHLAMFASNGRYTSSAKRTLYDEAEKPSIELVSMEFNLAERN